MSGKFNIHTSSLICDALHEAGLISDPTRLRRVVIDLHFNELPRIYTEALADDRILDVFIDSGIKLLVEAEPTA